IKASAWTPERRKEFESTDIMGSVKKLHSPLEASRFEYSTFWFWPMYPKQEPVKEPKILALVEPNAKSGKFIMVEQPQEQPQNLMAAEIDRSGDGAKVANADDDNAPRRTNDENAPRTVAGAAGTLPTTSGPSG